MTPKRPRDPNQLAGRLGGSVASKGHAGTECPTFRFVRSVHTARGSPAIFRSRGRAFI
jgi:hypothetical protein